MKTSDDKDTITQQSKSSGVKKTNILPAPMVGGTSISLEEELLDTKKPKARGVTKKAQTKIVELSK